MTISNLDRRSFLKKFRPPRPVQELEGIFGKARPLMQYKKQELPPVPPPASNFTIQGGLDTYQGPWDYEQAAHLIRRTTFGVKREDVDQLLTLSMEESVDLLLDIDPVPPQPPVNNYFDGNQEGYEDPVVPFGETWVEADYDQEAEGFRIESFRGWWTNLMVNQNLDIREKMTLFWHNHFATQTEAVFYGKTNYQHNTKLRTYALGNFKELTKVLTLDPMMLYYLNGFLNSAAAPDENYARELQELFTIGKESDNQYTEDDVLAAARVLTGWRVNPIPNETFFNAAEHDFGDKHFSSFYDNTVIQGGVDGEAELDEMLDMIFARQEVAEFICRKLYRWFVYYYIDETVEQDVIVPLAQVFRDNNYEILPVLATLFKSEHFFNAVNKGCFIKTPIDLVVGTLRTFNLKLEGTTLWDDLVFQFIHNSFLNDMQMMPGDPPNVAGWQAFRQFPQYYRIWINSDTVRNRNFYTDIITAFYFETENDQLKIDHIAFASQFDNPEDPNLLIDDLVRLLLPQPVSSAKKSLLKSILLTSLPNDGYWTNAWFAHINDPNDPMAFEVVNVRLTILHNYILKLPEYQLA